MFSKNLTYTVNMYKKVHKTVKSEIEAGIIILLLTAGVFFLPNHTIDPWDLFNPHRFGVIFLLIACVEFAGHIAILFLGNRMGMAMIGFFGGFISSTVIFITLPKVYKNHRYLLCPAIAAATLATIGMLIEFLIILYNLSENLFHIFLAPVVTMIMIGATSVILLRQGHIKELISFEKMEPLNLKSSLKLALWLFSMLIIIAMTIRYLGPKSGAVVSFLAGVFELHSVTVATTTLYLQKTLSEPNAILLLSLALLSAFVSKFIILWIMAKNRFALFTSAYLLAMLGGGVLGFISHQFLQ